MKDNRVNLVLGGGGVKGISYIGVFEEMEIRGRTVANISGVSAGALAGAYLASGLKAKEMKTILYDFNFSKLDVKQIPHRVPIVSRYLEQSQMSRLRTGINIDEFINISLYGNKTRELYNEITTADSRGDFFKNLLSLCKEGCLFDGDYLEQWVYGILKKKGIKTFEDVKGDVCDELNPKGYKIRMTAVDANRGRIIVLPDDLEFYNINPDRFEVAKAVRMSTCVPFAFKPVELKKNEGGKIKVFSIVDGGVIDNMPYWLINKKSVIPTYAFRFKNPNKNKIINPDTPLKIMNYILSKVHDTGVPKDKEKLSQVAEIDASKVSFLEFDLTDEEKEYLYLEGKNCAAEFFSKNRYIELKKNGLFEQFYNIFKKG